MRFARFLSFASSLLVAGALVLAACASATLAAQSVGRDRLPVVLKGRDLRWVNARNLTQIFLYRYDTTATPPWVPIPFQIDKRRKINFIHNVGIPTSIPENDRSAHDCALSYFPPRYCSSWTGPGYDGTVQECPLTYGAAFQSDLLGPTDEVVFMARDLGTARDTAPYEWLADDQNLASERLEIMVTDDANKNGAIEPDEEFWVYAYRWTQTPPAGFVSNAPPPTWAALPSCTPCADLEAPSNAFNEDCGTFRGPSGGLDGEGYEIQALSNWQYNDFRIIPGGSTVPNADILHSWRMGVDGVPGETNETWDCRALPRPMDVKVPGPGQVRVIRGIQGSASGVATMKYDKAYDSVFETEIELRVHELTNLYTRQGHNTSVKNRQRATTWAESVSDPPPGGGLKLWDRIDGNAASTTPPPRPDDWWQMIDGVVGGTASFTFADSSRGPLQANAVGFNYLDDQTEPYGEFGRNWQGVSCMQDGTVEGRNMNDGGCPADSDPESPDLLFKRLLRITIPTTAGVNETDWHNVRANDWEYAVRHPLVSGTSALQCKEDGSCGGPSPLPLCTPTMTSQLYADGSVGLAPDLSSGSNCSSDAGAFGLTAQAGGGTELVVGYVQPGSSYRFRNVLLGVTHVFRTFALAADGRVSPKSQPVSVTPVDTTPPPPPLVENVQGVTGGLSLDLQTCNDASGFLVNVYLSETSGGPYTQANPAPIYVSGPHHVTIAGLPNGHTYFGVATMVDLAGNESVYSPEFSFTTGP